MSSQIKVAIVDNDPVFNLGLTKLLEEGNGMVVTGEASEKEEAIRLVTQTKPDVLIIDSEILRLSGSDMTEQMREASPNTNFLVLGTLKHDSCLLAALQAKATGFLYKGECGSNIVNAIRSVSSGGHYIDHEVAYNLLAKLTGGGSRTVPTLQIHSRELEILKLAARGLTYGKIGQELGIKKSTVQAHIVNICRKFKVNSKIDAIRHALNEGLLSIEDIT